MSQVHLVLCRDDLRIHDQQALLIAVNAAKESGGRVVAAFVLDEDSEGIRPLGGAVKWWLHYSLERFERSLATLNIPLIIVRGQTLEVVPQLAQALDATHLYWSRRYAPAERAVDAALKEWAGQSELQAHSYTGFLLHEPWTVHPASGPFFKVFTPFWKTVSAQKFREPFPAPSALESSNAELPDLTGVIACKTLADLDLLPMHPNWAEGLEKRWTPGEDAALEACQNFVDSTVHDYSEGRDRPAQRTTSYLSPHLRFGEISPFTVLYLLHESNPDATQDTSRFASEIGWREFCWHLTFHNPDLHKNEFRPEWRAFSWRSAQDTETRDELTAWHKGETGISLVDAGMRELWQTGYMHNRVRMVVASLLTKNLLIDWRAGEQWFWDTLVDADTASNPCNWQWVAGCGADAAPYFRVFNPILQGAKFDAQARYIKQWVPELAAVDPKAIHQENIDGLGILAPNYPAPLVDLKASRQMALDAYQHFKNAS